MLDKAEGEQEGDGYEARDGYDVHLGQPVRHDSVAQ
jgi:hypothetical protein